MRVYLAGPINGCTDDEANGWRDQFKTKVPGVAFADPMVRDYRGREDECADEIVRADLADIDKSDVFLAYCWQMSWGTAMEIFYAAAVKHRVVIVVIPEGQRISPWLRHYANCIVRTLDEAADVIRHRRAGERWGWSESDT